MINSHRLFKYLAFIFIWFSFFNCNSSKTRQVKPKINFKVEIVQDKKVIPIVNNKVKLMKKPFKFRITHYKSEYLSVSASFDRYYYDYPSGKNIYECNDNQNFKECRFVSVKTVPESKFNPNKELIVGGKNTQLDWFYSKSIDWHRYDSNVIVTENSVITEKTIENIFDIDLRNKRTEGSIYNYKIENLNKDIYMVFATDFYKSGMKHPVELQREKIVISF